MMETISNLIVTAFEQTVLSLLHNWPFLLVGILISAMLKKYLDAEKIAAFLQRFRGLGVVAATGVAVGTPLCSCGTTAVILGMMASTMPWAPIVAFMVASPMTSPEGLFYSAGLFGWPFALAFFTASILLGLAGGGAAALLESRGWLVDQTRFSAPAASPAPAACGCSQGTDQSNAPYSFEPDHLISLASMQPAGACGCSQTPVQFDEPRSIRLEILQPASACGSCGTLAEPSALRNPDPFQGALKAVAALEPRLGIGGLLREAFASGKKLLPMFLGFAFIGYVLNGLIPAGWVAAFFGSGNAYSVPLAATLGIPLYFNSEGSLPLIRALLEQGLGQGAALAFLVAGSGTSLGAIAGALTIARWRVVGLVIAVLWAGAIVTGYAYDLLLAMNLF